MKIIFSRKGFDSSAGGVPSPIVGGRPISLPIPLELKHSRYQDLRDPTPELVVDLTHGRHSAKSYCHLDPDIDPSATRAVRPKSWRGAVGQVGAAQSHLRRQGVGPGDLFLFWGLFQHVSRANGRWRYEGHPMHLIFGWLEIDEAHLVGNRGADLINRHSWLSNHPHVRPGWERWSSHERSNNTVYIASERLSVLPFLNLPGSGVFAKGYVLTSPNSHLKSVWQVPDWLHPRSGGSGMSFHPPGRWLGGGEVRSAGRGQEFVADIGSATGALRWLEAVFVSSV
ncbi:hypothetical protein [Mesorhizobium sp. ES1-3]|uniref:Nmad3 family putative nucleotide modification protein n=1 Tax=Mesorhizobium sp. ES1-3 TaxID=2876628 RepID=UPI001CCB2ABC|nr:hypothetical protein [Mesorhizobium sp. ES1-3]